MEPVFLVVDLFCGAGGTTTGFEMANGLAKVIACVNHDPLAIKSHWLNHPDVVHFEEDIRTLRMGPLKAVVDKYRKLYPNAKLILWASLECTNFSNAKGGQSRDADSRTLANHLDRYIKALKPDIIQIENVVEFMSWGPLRIKADTKKSDPKKEGEPEPTGLYTKLKVVWNKKKKVDEYAWEPLSRTKGKDWLAWRERLCSYGYRNDWKKMNAADWGAYTSRNRLFGIFAKEGIPIRWPEATHAKNPSKNPSLFGTSFEKWKAVREVLDFEDEGRSIFNRETPIVDNSLERIYAGLIKFVAGGQDKFMMKYNSMNSKGQYTPPSLDDPCPTIAVQQRIGMVFTESFLSKMYSGKPEGKNISVDGPAGTFTTVDSHALINSVFIAQRNNGEPKSRAVSVDGPARTLTATGGNQDLITANFLTKYHGAGFNSSVEQPAPVLATKDQIAMVRPCFVLSPQWGGNSSGLEVPSPTIIARQDKAPLYLVYAVSGQFNVPVYEEDSEILRKIKEFMALYGIVDIKMRMLKVLEMLKIQGFPETYKLEGSQGAQKKFIGNSVVPLLPKVWALALADMVEEKKCVREQIQNKSGIGPKGTCKSSDFLQTSESAA